MVRKTFLYKKFEEVIPCMIIKTFYLKFLEMSLFLMSLLSFLVLDRRSRLGGIVRGGLKIIVNIALYITILFWNCRKESNCYTDAEEKEGEVGTRFSRKRALKRINVRHLNVYNISRVDIPSH